MFPLRGLQNNWVPGCDAQEWLCCFQVEGPGHDLEDFYLYPSVIRVSSLEVLCFASPPASHKWVNSIAMHGVFTGQCSPARPCR